MICYQHEVTCVKPGVNPASRIRKYEILDAECCQHPHRKRDCLHVMAFVVVASAIQDQHRSGTEIAYGELACVAGNRRHRKTWQVAIADFCSRPQCACKSLESGPEHESQRGRRRVSFAN